MFLKAIILLSIVAFASAKRDKRFDSHLRRHKKNYDNLSAETVARRERNYLKNLEFIEEHNKNPKNSFKLRSNEFSDRNHTRFVEDYCGYKPSPTPRALPKPPSIFPQASPAFSYIDWRHLAQPIVNQGACGSCWAFVAISVLGEMK